MKNKRDPAMTIRIAGSFYFLSLIQMHEKQRNPAMAIHIAAVALRAQYVYIIKVTEINEFTSMTLIIYTCCFVFHGNTPTKRTVEV